MQRGNNLKYGICFRHKKKQNHIFDKYYKVVGKISKFIDIVCSVHQKVAKQVLQRCEHVGDQNGECNFLYTGTFVHILQTGI